MGLLSHYAFDSQNIAANNVLGLFLLLQKLEDRFQVFSPSGNGKRVLRFIYLPSCKHDVIYARGAW